MGSIFALQVANSGYSIGYGHLQTLHLAKPIIPSLPLH